MGLPSAATRSGAPLSTANKLDAFIQWKNEENDTSLESQNCFKTFLHIISNKNSLVILYHGVLRFLGLGFRV